MFNVLFWKKYLKKMTYLEYGERSWTVLLDLIQSLVL